MPRDYSKYSISIERGDHNYRELEHLYKMHYQEMQVRLKSDGIDVGDYNPRLDKYFESFAEGWLINYVVRYEGLPIGYSNIYITNDMHNSELIAHEDTIYIHPDHRNGIGKVLTKFVLDDLRSRSVKRVCITPVTDLRVAKIWKRMGFKEAATLMSYTFRR